MRIRRVCILGGTGFIGREIANRLANTSISIKVLTRHRERNRHLLPIPNLDLFEADVHNPVDLHNHLEDVDAVINLVAILNEGKKSGRRFEDVHVHLVEKILVGPAHCLVLCLIHSTRASASSLFGGPGEPE